MKKLLLLSIFCIGILQVWAQESYGLLMFSARMDTAQEGNLDAISSARGIAGFSFHNDTLWFDITASGLTGPITGAHIHTESTGGVEYSLYDFINGNKVKGYLPGISFSEGGLQPFLDGQFYVNIHTEANPNGEIAGRILPETDFNYRAVLDMAQAGHTNPPDHTPSGLGSFNLGLDNNKLEVNVLVNDLTSSITNAHLHYGAPGVSGPVIVPISQFRNGDMYQGVFDLTTLTNQQAFLDSLRMGKVYVNIHTTNYPGGEIRGQLLQSRPLSFDTWMSSAQETGTVNPSTPVDARGLCNFTVNSSIDSIWINIQADSLSGPITGAHFHSGKVGESGPVVVNLTSFIQGNMISGILTPASPEFTADLNFASFVGKVLSEDIYVNMHTALNPAGEVRGQPISLAREGVAYSLCSSQETGTTTGGGNAQGSGFVSIDRNYSNLHFGMAVSNLSSAVVADHFHHALPGTSGPVLFALPTDSVISGFWNDETFTAEISDLFENGEMYANFHTSVNPAGEVRGQVAVGDFCAGSTGIPELVSKDVTAVSIFPNPVQTVAHIEYSLPVNGKVVFSLYDMLGKEVMRPVEGNEVSGIHSQIIDMTGIPEGVYFFRMLVNGISVDSGKAIVSR